MYQVSHILLLFLAFTASAVSSDNLSQKNQHNFRCNSPHDVDSVLRPGVVLTLGEIHGTNEIPDLIGELACVALEKNLSVTVGLEILDDEQERINHYLQSDGSDSARDRMLSGHFWRRETQDGRSSEAMLELIEHLRELRAKSDGRLRVLAIDNVDDNSGRDHAMAAHVAVVYSAIPEGLIITLTGNVHNRLLAGSDWDAEYQPFAYQLTQLIPDAQIISLNVAHQGGSAWVQTSAGCQPVNIGSNGGGEGRTGIALYPVGTVEIYSGYFYIGEVSASSPAVEN